MIGQFPTTLRRVASLSEGAFVCTRRYLVGDDAQRMHEAEKLFGIVAERRRLERRPFGNPTLAERSVDLLGKVLVFLVGVAQSDEIPAPFRKDSEGVTGEP